MYHVRIKEVVYQDYEIEEATTGEEAITIAMNKYKSEEIVLEPGNIENVFFILLDK